MPAKKKKTKKRAKAKKTARKKASTRKKASIRRKASTRKTARVARKTARAAGKRSREGKPAGARVIASQAARSGAQSGDLQGLSTREGADSESVRELLEEGNPFEAGVVTGVEEAERAAERPVHTQEVPEDDVPDEYLDKD